MGHARHVRQADLCLDAKVAKRHLLEVAHSQQVMALPLFLSIGFITSGSQNSKLQSRSRTKGPKQVSKTARLILLNTYTTLPALSLSQDCFEIDMDSGFEPPGEELPTNAGEEDTSGWETEDDIKNVLVHCLSSSDSNPTIQRNRPDYSHRLEVERVHWEAQHASLVDAYMSWSVEGSKAEEENGDDIDWFICEVITLTGMFYPFDLL
jgi:hypothetical protein